MVRKCRGKANQLGFCYQLIFVKVANRFPIQKPLEVNENILDFSELQTNIKAVNINCYQKRQQTVSEHQSQIRQFLGLRKLDKKVLKMVEDFVFKECCHLDQISLILIKTELFLREQGILCSAQATLERLVSNQRENARRFIYSKIYESLSTKSTLALDDLLESIDGKYSKLQKLKIAPLSPSTDAIISLIEKLDIIKATNVSEVNLAWLNNNYQRNLSRYANRYSTHRLKETEIMRGYAILTCFLRQIYNETIDYIIETYFKLIQKVYSRAENKVNDEAQKQRKKLQESLIAFNVMSEILLDEAIVDSDVRKMIFKRISKESIVSKNNENEIWLRGKFSHSFKLIIQRFNYLRQFSPLVLKHILLKSNEAHSSELLQAVDLLRKLNEQNKRNLPDNAPFSFIPKTIRSMVKKNGELDKHAWECAVLVAIRDEIKAGNIYIPDSKRYANIDSFFMPDKEWKQKSDAFFERAGLPENPKHLPEYLKNRLNKIFYQLIDGEQTNKYASVKEGQWVLSVDEAEVLTDEQKTKLDKLKKWLSNRMRTINLPELLIEVDK